MGDCPDQVGYWACTLEIVLIDMGLMGLVHCGQGHSLGLDPGLYGRWGGVASGGCVSIHLSLLLPVNVM